LEILLQSFGDIVYEFHLQHKFVSQHSPPNPLRNLRRRRFEASDLGRCG
jgi:hypothetical protein